MTKSRLITLWVSAIVVSVILAVLEINGFQTNQHPYVFVGLVSLPALLIIVTNPKLILYLKSKR